MIKTCLALIGALMLGACAPLLGMMAGMPAAQPPQAPAQVTTASRTGIDFALNSFDAVLYGLDFAMDAKKIVPGSDRAKQLAAIGRKVMGSLEVADSALKLGNSATYEDAFATAKSLLEQFKSLFVQPAGLSFVDGPRVEQVPPLTRAQREAILDRLDHGITNA
jgi:hypothetical protein